MADHYGDPTFRKWNRGYFHQLLAIGWWFPPGAPVSSTSETDIPSPFHRLDMTLAVGEALSQTKLKQRFDNDQLINSLGLTFQPV